MIKYKSYVPRFYILAACLCQIHGIKILSDSNLFQELFCFKGFCFELGSTLNQQNFEINSLPNTVYLYINVSTLSTMVYTV